MDSVEEFLKKNSEAEEAKTDKRKSENVVGVKIDLVEGKRKKITNPYAKGKAKKYVGECNSGNNWSDEFLAAVIVAEEKHLEKKEQENERGCATEVEIQMTSFKKEAVSPSGVIQFHGEPSGCLLPKRNEEIIGTLGKERHVLISWVPLQGGIGLFRLCDTQFSVKYYSWTSKFNEKSSAMHKLWLECKIVGVVYLRESRDKDTFAMCPGNYKQTALVYNPGPNEAYNKRLAVQRMRMIVTYLNAHNTLNANKKSGDFYKLDAEDMKTIVTPVVEKECSVLGHFTTDISTSFIFDKLFDKPVHGWRTQIGTLKKYFVFPFSTFVLERYQIVKIEKCVE